jgi:hypothetical protein
MAGTVADDVINEDDLVIADEEGDLHLPHFIARFGGIVRQGTVTRAAVPTAPATER